MQLAKLALRLIVWNVNNPVGYSPPIAVSYHMQMQLLGLESHVHDGIPQEVSRIVMCACCGKTYELPFHTTFWVVPFCIHCSPERSSSGRYPIGTLLAPVNFFIASLPRSVQEDLRDLLTDKYFTQLSHEGVDTRDNVMP
jgi:hypothetical protein